jgi:hypothetical protein
MIIIAPYFGLTGSSVAARGDTVSTGLLLAAIVKALPSILNGAATSTVAVNGPATFLGSRHESEQVPPQPYWKLKVRSYVPSALLIFTLGACG